MTAAELTREGAALLAAAGVVALLSPWPSGGRVARRAAGLGAAVVGALVLLGSLVGGERLADALGSPARLGLGGLALALAAAVLYGGSRLVLARPLAWFLLLALALPVRLPVTFGGQSASLLVPLYAVIAIGVAAWVLGRATGRLGPGDDPATPLDPVLAAFVGFLLVSSLWSADGEEAAVKAGFFYVPFVLLYLLVVAWWPRAVSNGTLRTRRLFRAPALIGTPLAALTVTTIALAVPVAAFALWQYGARELFWNATLQQANVYSRFFRVNGIFYDPNILGRFLGLALLGALAMGFVVRGRRRAALLAGAAAVAGAGLVVTFSRSSALMLVVGVLMIAAWAFGTRRTAVAGGALLALVAVAAVVVSDPVRDAVTSAERLERVSEGRFDLARGGLSIWREDPVLGTGLGGFESRFEETLTPIEQRRTRVLISHNAPVTILSEGGIVGLALFLAVLVATALALGRGARRAGAPGLARWTLLSGLAGILVHSLFYSALFEDPYTWVLAGAAIALGAGAAAPAPVAAAPPERPPVPVS